MAGRFVPLGRAGRILKGLPQFIAYRLPSTHARCLYTSNLLLGAMPVKMPALSPTMTEGTIIKWYKQEGDPVVAGDILCDIQTDKAVVSFEMDEDGILAKILKPDDSKDVKIGTLIAMMVEEGEDWQNVEIPADTGPSDPVQPAPSSEATTSAPTPALESSTQLGYGPAVRSLLDIYQIKVTDVTGTGPHNRVLKGDVLTYIRDKNIKPAPLQKVEPPAVSKPPPAKQPATPPSVSAAKPSPPPRVVLSETEDYVDIELTSMRRTIARRLTESKTTIPHAYATVTCHMNKIIALRKELIEEGTKVSVNDFIVKAAAVALHQVPEVNATWTGEARRLQDNIDICVAVATDNGLITPIVKDALGKGVEEISSDIKDLAGRAKAGKLQLHEFQGGSFTISNLGMFGITEFSAVINPPQACILAVGGSRIVPDEDGHPVTTMTVTMSSDARVVDDALASRWLESFRETIENPMIMLSQGLKPDIASGESSLDSKTADLDKLFAQ